MSSLDHQTERIANEIIRYLAKFPQSADTLTGVAHWWLHSSRAGRSIVQVQDALELLVARGIVRRNRNTDGTIIYKRAPMKHE